MKSPVFVLLLLISFSLSGQISVGKVNIQELYENDPQYTQKMDAVSKYHDSVYARFRNSNRFIEMVKESEELAKQDPNHPDLQRNHLELKEIQYMLDQQVQQKMNDLLFTQEVQNAMQEVQKENELEGYLVHDSQGQLLAVLFQTAKFESQVVTDNEARKKELAEPYLDTESSGIVDNKRMVQQIMNEDFTGEIIMGYAESAKDYTKDVLDKVY